MIEDYWLHHYAEHGTAGETIDDGFDENELEQLIEQGEWEEVIRG